MEAFVNQPFLSRRAKTELLPFPSDKKCPDCGGDLLAIGYSCKKLDMFDGTKASESLTWMCQRCGKVFDSGASP